MAARGCRDVTSSSRSAINTPHSGASTSRDCVENNRQSSAAAAAARAQDLCSPAGKEAFRTRMVEKMAPASCWKMDARPLLAAAANYAGAPKRRRAFCFHTDYVFQSLRHSYCSILTNLTSSPLMQIREVTPRNPDFRDNQADLLSIHLKHNVWLKIFGGKKINICYQNTK